jgi:trans-2,3-dihydro-3-hydroxyanthranilate isomerase
MTKPGELARNELEYFVLDVFTSSALAGNPLAVVMNPGHLTTEQMQRIALEFNLSETTFVERRAAQIEQAEGVRVRIFTTQEELPFAGHPTLGTASVLKFDAPEPMRGETITLALNVGSIPVRFSGDGRFGEMTQCDPEFGDELDSAAVARLLGLELADLSAGPPPQIVSTGTAFAIVLLKSLDGLARLNTRRQEATAWLREHGARWFYVLAPSAATAEAGGPLWRARMQFNGGEDPATGSAAGCAISYLVGHNLVPPGVQATLRQGSEMRRPSELFLTASRVDGQVREVRVAGSTVLVAKGRLFLP